MWATKGWPISPHIPTPPTTEVTTLRPYHHLTRLPAPSLLALLLTAVTEKELKLKQSLLCSWPSNGSHISQNQIPYKGLTSSCCPFHVSNHFFHSFKHGSSHGSLLAAPGLPTLPSSEFLFLLIFHYLYLHPWLPSWLTPATQDSNVTFPATSMLYPFTHTHTHTHSHSCPSFLVYLLP